MTTTAGTPEEDVAFWQALRRRDPEAYERLQTLVEGVCAPVFRRFGATPDQVEVLLQDVLVSVWEYASKDGEDPVSLRSFLYWRARGVWTHWLRRGRGREAPLEEASSPSFERDEALDALVGDELDRAFHDCRAGLDEKYRQVWEARFERGEEPQETAEALGIDRGQVAVRLHRARRALEECLRRRGMLA